MALTIFVSFLSNIEVGIPLSRLVVGLGCFKSSKSAGIAEPRKDKVLRRWFAIWNVKRLLPMSLSAHATCFFYSGVLT